MGSAAVTCFAKAHWHLRIARQSNVAAIPGLGAIIELLLNLAPFLIPILIDFYAERVFKTRLYDPSEWYVDDVSVTGAAPSAVPLPAALPLFASGLGALGLLGWRRKRKNAAALAA